MSDIEKMMQGLFGNTMMFTKKPEIIDKFSEEGNLNYIDADNKVRDYLFEFFNYELFRGRYTESVKWEGQHPAFKATYFKHHGRDFKVPEFMHYCLYPWGNENVKIYYNTKTNLFIKEVVNKIVSLPNFELEVIAHKALSEYMNTNKCTMLNPQSFLDGFMAAHKQQQ